MPLARLPSADRPARRRRDRDRARVLGEPDAPARRHEVRERQRGPLPRAQVRVLRRLSRERPGLVTVFSDRLGGLTVAFGVAGAGIAFALQEVIASVAGWVAISFGDFYRPATASSSAASRATSSTSACCAPP